MNDNSDICNSNKDLKEVQEIYEDLLKGNIAIDDAIHAVFDRIESVLPNYKDLLSECRTANLWFQYLDILIFSINSS
jgi:2-hydroxy-3-keto-5-methylthiopentenyl-1-phosphate phosphatase